MHPVYELGAAEHYIRILILAGAPKAAFETAIQYFSFLWDLEMV